MEELIFTYFPELTEKQRDQITQLYPLYKEWNSKINVISRKDIDSLYIHHVLHSLSIARYIKFPAGSKVLDVGTGGGFPGIPLAIMFPDVSFYLCDSILKKIKVVKEISSSLCLTNIVAEQIRAEEIGERFDFVVSRAVTELKTFLPWIWKKLDRGEINGIERGVIYLKGGDLIEEINEAQKLMNISSSKISRIEIQKWFKEPIFDQKCILYIKR
jgi:16S rRNA (guanine527-N7)-methyltransferase